MNAGPNLYTHAKRIIPGGVQLLSKRPEQFLPGVWPAYYTKAKGCEIWDLDGNKFVDMSFMGIGACTLGYADDDVNAAVQEVIANGSMATLNPPKEVELAGLLLELHPWAQMARFTRGGGEAMAVAVRIARAATRKDIILFSGYHGWHDWYLSANLADDAALDGQLLPGLKPAGIPRNLKGTSFPFRYNNTAEFLELVGRFEAQIAGVVLETIRNIEPERNFFATLERETARLKVPLIVDEVSSGFRMNCGGAHLVVGLQPDMAVFAKGISNGFPMGAVIGKAKYMDAAQDTFVSSTYWTERIGPAAALATIKKMKACHVQQHLMACGKQVQEGWNHLAAKHGIDIHVGSIYPLSHFDFKVEPLVCKTLYTQEMLAKGFLATTSFYSSYAHQQAHIRAFLRATDEVFGTIAAALKSGNPRPWLKGPVCQSGFKRLT